MASSFRETITLFISQELSPASRAAWLMAVAHERRDELIANGQASEQYRTTVDGSDTKLESQATDNITYEFSYMNEIVAFALGYLRTRAPYGSGRFANSFVVGINGDMVPARALAYQLIPPRAEIIISNTQPYNRKVDVQLLGNERMQYSVPAGMYDDAARAIRGRFGNQISAVRRYNIQFPGQWVRKTGQVGRLVTYPGIIITPR